MASVPFKILTGILVALLISSIIAFAVIVSDGTCSNTRSPKYYDLCCGLDDNCKFKTRALRLMADRVYEYRIATEYKEPSDAFISVFMMRNIPDPKSLPTASFLTDVALHHLITSKDKFNILLSYIPIFNHPRYVECIKAFNHKTKLFRGIDPSLTTKEIIIQQILGFGQNTTDSVAKVYSNCYKMQTATDKSKCVVEQPVAYDQTCIDTNPQDKTKCIIQLDPSYDNDCLLDQRRQACLAKMNIGVDITNLDTYMIAYLTNSSDESLYNLLQNGFSGTSLSTSLP